MSRWYSIDESFANVNIINYSPDIKEENNNKIHYISNNLSIHNAIYINNIKNITTITNKLQNFLILPIIMKNIIYDILGNNIKFTSTSNTNTNTNTNTITITNDNSKYINK